MNDLRPFLVFVDGCSRAASRRLWTTVRLVIPSLFLVWAFGISADATSESGFRSVLPGYQFHFPYDHGSHDEFQTEWWYYTGHLSAQDGRRFGFQVTFFRRAVGNAAVSQNPSRWALRQIYFGHFALTDETQHRFHFTETISRAGIKKAGAKTGDLGVWIDNWRVETNGDVHTIQARHEDMALELRLSPSKPPIVHGSDGISRKGDEPGEASHYYSFSRMEAAGTITVYKRAVPVIGQAWMDHEFGSNQLGESQVGWDWFSIQLEDQTELMVYQIRRRDGSIEPASGGTWIRADGTIMSLPQEAFTLEVLQHWLSPAQGTRYPSRWRIVVPSLHLDVELTPTVSDQELVTQHTHVTYWEGSVSVSGARDGKKVTGLGYAELTGYAASLHKRL